MLSALTMNRVMLAFRGYTGIAEVDKRDKE